MINRGHVVLLMTLLYYSKRRLSISLNAYLKTKGKNMAPVSLEDYKIRVRNERTTFFPQPYDLIYKNFLQLGYHHKDQEYFLNNASEVVEELRSKSWEDFRPIEKEFTSKMLSELIDEELIKDWSPLETITWFVENFPDHIYNLTLSNTQSRRSRAGKEFETIIELILIGAGISLDSQGTIGKKTFTDKGIGKIVDVVSPGVVEYVINKRNTVLISAKTTLRERWQEVPEEMGRTGAREMFLATLDTTISERVLETLYEANIQVTTTKRIKEEFYADNHRVLTFEQLLNICKLTGSQWDSFNYTLEQEAQIAEIISKQIDKHEHREFITNYYKNRLDNI